MTQEKSGRGTIGTPNLRFYYSESDGRLRVFTFLDDTKKASMNRLLPGAILCSPAGKENSGES
jgi:hypothetical protein